MKVYVVNFLCHHPKFGKGKNTCPSFDKYSKEMKLSELRQGDRARIKAFQSADLQLKLMEMGCIPGEEVTVEQIAPLGDPISIKVAGYSLSLRLNEADQIIIER